MPAESVPTNGAAIRALRQAYGLKVYELADRAGITDGYLSNIEHGRKNASPGTLRRIASAIGVPLAAVTGGSRAVEDVA